MRLAFSGSYASELRLKCFCSQVARTSTEVLTIKTLKIKEMITNVIISFMVGVRRLYRIIALHSAVAHCNLLTQIFVRFAPCYFSVPFAYAHFSLRKILSNFNRRFSLSKLPNKKGSNKSHFLFYGGR